MRTALKKKPSVTVKKRMTGEERREQIVKVATGLFSRNGFGGTTTREIAKKAGISEAVIFKHFSRKEDLYKAIIDSCCSDTEGSNSLIKLLHGKRGAEVFRTVASHLIELHQRDPSFLRLLLYSALEKHSLSELFIKTRGLELLEYLEGHIKELIKSGEMRDIDPCLAARAFLNMTLHYSISQELFGLKKYFKRDNRLVVDAFVEIFLEGMRRR